VKVFVGIIAERHARAELQHVGPEARHAVDGAP
jgi:hypothetical protein